jgi:hypothetical protein
MKGFSQFFSEATESQAVMQAKRLGLTGDGHGGWYDKNGEFVAKTEKGRLKFYNQNQRIGKQDPPQQRTANNQQPVATQTQPAQQQDQPQGKSQDQPQSEPQGEPQGEFGTFADGTPRRMAPPTNADGSPKEDLGTLVVTFGRFNPPTVGHKKLLDAARKAAGKGALKIYPSRSQDPKKNPLDPDEKVDVMKQMYPDHADSIVNDPNSRSIFDVLKQAHADGYSDVKIVVGGDRVQEFGKMSDKYNGQIYDFAGVQTISAGERDPDAEGVEGMSASKMRKAAAENDFKTFRQGVPDTIDDKAAKMMMNSLRKKMNVKEGWNLWEIAPKFDWKNLRENYFKNKLYDIGELVENLNTGLVGRVIRRGANYLICVTEDNIMFKSWIKDVSEAVVNNNAPSGVPPNQREVGTDAHREYVMNLMGVKEIKNFINKYRKKTTK